MKEREEDELIEEMIRRTVAGKPRGKLSPFFAAKMVNLAKSEAREKDRSLSQTSPLSSLLRLYWFALLAMSIFAILSVATSELGRTIVLLLAPAGFGLALVSREILGGFFRVAVLLLE